MIRRMVGVGSVAVLVVVGSSMGTRLLGVGDDVVVGSVEHHEPCHVDHEEWFDEEVGAWIDQRFCDEVERQDALDSWNRFRRYVR